MLQDQLKHFYNVVLSLNRVNDGDNLGFSGSKFQRCLDLYGIGNEFDSHLLELEI